MSKLFTIFASAFLASTALAQDTAKHLPSVVITANKHNQKQSETGKVVTVIDKEVLERSKGRSIGEVLNVQAGLTVVGANNILGTNQDVYMRGAAVGKTLILLDGIPVYDPSSISGAFDINTISIDHIERIEIVKGAQSTFYGSDAVAGVINIITKKGGERPLQATATLSAGSFNTYKGVAGISGSKNKWDYNLNYTHINSKGISSAHDTTGTANFDRDGFNQNVLNASIARALNNKINIRLYGQASRYHSDLDAGAFADERDFTVTTSNFNTGATGTIAYSKGLVTINYNFNRMVRDYLDDSIHVGGFANFVRQNYAGNTHFAEAFTNHRINNKVEVLLGADYRYQTTDQEYLSLSNWGPYETKLGSDSAKAGQASLYTALFLKNLGGFFLEAGGRLNNHTTYGTHFTYSLNPSYAFGERWRIFGNISSGFKAPSLYQLFDGNFGNEQLKAEESATAEGGLEYRIGNKFRARGVYFNRTVTNGIDYNFVTNQYFNFNKQKDHGFELEGDYRTNKIFLNANYTFVTGEVNAVNFKYNPATWSYEAAGDTTFNNLFRRPKHAVNVTVGYSPVSEFYFSVITRIIGERMESIWGAAPVALEPYQTIDLYAEYNLNKRFKIFADLKNITNTQFVEVRGYNIRGFNFMAGLHVSL